MQVRGTEFGLELLATEEVPIGDRGTAPGEAARRLGDDDDDRIQPVPRAHCSSGGRRASGDNTGVRDGVCVCTTAKPPLPDAHLGVGDAVLASLWPVARVESTGEPHEEGTPAKMRALTPSAWDEKHCRQPNAAPPVLVCARSALQSCNNARSGDRSRAAPPEAGLADGGGDACAAAAPSLDTGDMAGGEAAQGESPGPPRVRGGEASRLCGRCLAVAPNWPKTLRTHNSATRTGCSGCVVRGGRGNAFVGAGGVGVKAARSSSADGELPQASRSGAPASIAAGLGTSPGGRAGLRPIEAPIAPAASARGWSRSGLGTTPALFRGAEPQCLSASPGSGTGSGRHRSRWRGSSGGGVTSSDAAADRWWTPSGCNFGDSVLSNNVFGNRCCLGCSIKAWSSNTWLAMSAPQWSRASAPSAGTGDDNKEMRPCGRRGCVAARNNCTRPHSSLRSAASATTASTSAAMAATSIPDASLLGAPVASSRSLTSVMPSSEAQHRGVLRRRLGPSPRAVGCWTSR
mmetsp:Transcript_83899/g.242589  ORF Transcript_83899/g.242589 Transcript_83899/m.242589 type:complete len:517 (+) Transcript_83899:582-2132(+)